MIATPRDCDFDTIKTNGINIYITDGSTYPVNLPSGFYWGVVLVFGLDATNNYYQIAYDLKQSICKGRSYNQEEINQWSPWRDIIV